MGPADLVVLVALALAARGLADPVVRAPAAQDLVVLATPVGLVGRVVLADTTRVAPEATGDMGLVDRADLASPVVRGRVALAAMIPEDPEDPEDPGIRDRAERFMTAQDP